jgi:trk system potassium uptake protein TrkH
MKLDYRSVIHVLGMLLMINGAFMVLCLPATFYFHTADLLPILLSAAITIGAGFMAWVLNRPTEKPNIKKREAALIVTVGWLVMSVSGAFPYLLSGSIPSFTDAFFESMSGYTTTGASVITNLDVIAPDILAVAQRYPLDWRNGNYCARGGHTASFGHWRHAAIWSRSFGHQHRQNISSHYRYR